MKKQFLILFLFIAFIFSFALSCRQNAAPVEKQIATLLITQTDSFSQACKTLQNEAVHNTANASKLQQLFLQARLAYKTFEWAAEYFEPATSRRVNGAPVQEIELSGRVVEPSGLQVVEGLLFPAYDTANRQALLQQLTLLQKHCNRFKIHFQNVDLFNWQVFDALKLEVFRIETLGITGFDNPLTLQSMQEASRSLCNVQRILAFYDNPKAYQNLAKTCEAARLYLSNHDGFNTFNRADFITTYCNPITAGLTTFAKQLNIQPTRYNRLLNQDAATLFDADAFNANAFTPDQSSFATVKKIALGKKLFADPILSGNGARSCQSCHQPDKAFTDGLVKNFSLNNNQTIKRNTPTLINAALQSAQFYDLRVNTLENQSLDVVQSTIEMHGSLKLSAQKLWSNEQYRQLFAAAFPNTNRDKIDTLEVMNAIASYVRSLTALNSRFDDYMRGNKTALNEDEVNGFNLFMGKAKCATCHYMPLFNGTLPPRYMKTEAEVIGVPATADGKVLDSDEGRYDIVKATSLKHAFKTPTLRNAALTAPYMHNGVYATLEQVVDFYNKGGGKGLGIAIGNQTLPFDKLNLTKKESDDIVSFIKSLESKQATD